MRTALTKKCCIPFCLSPPSTLLELPLTMGYKKMEKMEWFQKINCKQYLPITHPTFYLKKGINDSICPLHFEDSDYAATIKGAERKLLLNAIPTIFPWSPKWIQLPAVKEMYPAIPATHYDLLSKGSLDSFCIFCNFHTSRANAWQDHMRGHLDKETNQKKQKLLSDKVTSHPKPESKRQKLEVSNAPDAKPSVKSLPSSRKATSAAPALAITHTEKVPCCPPIAVDPLAPLNDEKNPIFKEEADLRQQLDQLNQAMMTDYEAMETLRKEPIERLNMLKQKVEVLERREGKCRRRMPDVTAKRKAVGLRSAELSERKKKVEIAVNLMLEAAPLIPGLKAQISEDVNPFLHHFQKELDSLKNKIKDARTEEEELQKSFIKLNTSYADIQRNLVLTRKELTSAAIAVEDRCLSQRLQKLVEGQRERIQSYATIERQLVDVVLKRRLLFLDDFASFKTDVPQ